MSHMSFICQICRLLSLLYVPRHSGHGDALRQRLSGPVSTAQIPGLAATVDCCGNFVIRNLKRKKLRDLTSFN